MEVSLPARDLGAYVFRLLAHHFPDGKTAVPIEDRVIDLALNRLENCFTRIHRKYYNFDGRCVFDHMHGDHMATFLYFLANTSWKEAANAELATRLSYLNKVMHGLDLFYSVSMPDVFLLVHPLGTVLGHAEYGNYLVVYQGCTVGATGSQYPTFSEGTILYSRSSVLGACRIGKDVIFGANAMVIDDNVPSSTVVVGQHPSVRLLKNETSVRERCFDPMTSGTSASGSRS